MDVRGQLNIVRSWLPLLLASVLLAAVAGFALSSLQPRVYELKATVLVGQSLSGVNPDYNQLLASQRLSATYAAVATTDPVLSGVIKDLGLSTTPTDLRKRVFASAAQDTALLTITARDGDPATAAGIANAVAAKLISASPTVQGQHVDISTNLAAIQAELTSNQADIDALNAIPDRSSTQEAQLQTLEGRRVSLLSTYATLLAFSSNDAANVLTVVQPAVAPDDSVSPRPLLDALLAAFIAFLVVSIVVFVVEYLDDAVKDPDEARTVLDLPTLASIERMRGDRKREPMYRLVSLLQPRSRAAEAYRALRTNVEFATVDRPIRTILVTSAVPSEGKTVTAANFAVVIAQSGRRVLLIDADFRKPGVDKIFRLPNTRGLTDLMRSPGIAPASLVQATEQEGLHVLSAGPTPPNPAEILGSERMKAIVTTLTDAYDVLVFDSPPLDVFTDAAVLSSYLDATILVVESRRGRRDRLRRAREALANAGATVVGLVLNGVARNARDEGYGYYGTGDETASPTVPAPSVGMNTVASGGESSRPTSGSR